MRGELTLCRIQRRQIDRSPSHPSVFRDGNRRRQQERFRWRCEQKERNGNRKKLGHGAEHRRFSNKWESGVSLIFTSLSG
jgi:hypothetical protein